MGGQLRGSGRGRSSPRTVSAICLRQQLVAAGERVLDVPATLAARVRVLATGRSNKNDPNDALVGRDRGAARASRARRCSAADHAVVLRLLAKRNLDLGRLRNRTACRLHALLCELVAGGIPKEITPNKAQRLLDALEPQTPVERTRHELALRAPRGPPSPRHADARFQDAASPTRSPRRARR